MEPLLDSWSLLSDQKALRACGFCVTLPQLQAMGAVDDGDPLGCLAEEGKWVMWLVGLLCSLTRNRFRHLLAYTHGPALFAALLSESPAVVKWALARLRAIWHGYETLKACGAAAARMP